MAISDKFDTANGAYDTFVTAADAPIYKLLDAAGDIFSGFSGPVTVAAAIYIALMGYAVLFGKVSLSMNDAAVRLSKLVLIVVFVQSYFWFATIFYNGFWTIPTYITNFFLSAIDPAISFNSPTTVSGTSGSFIVQNPDLNMMVDNYSQSVLALVSDFLVLHKGADTTAFIFWLIYMSPFVAAMLIIIISKIVSVLLFILAPLVFIAALIGYSNHFLLGWLRQLIVLSLTVIIAYMLFVLVITMVSEVATATYDNLGTVSAKSGGSTVSYKNITIPVLFPVGALSIIGLFLIAQAPFLANRIVGAFGFESRPLLPKAERTSAREARASNA